MFSTFEQKGKPRLGCYGIHQGYCWGRVLLFESLYAGWEEREGSIALLATFSHCLDWVLRGDGSRGGGMKAGIKKRVATTVAEEGPHGECLGVGYSKEERVYTYPLIL